MTSFTKYTVKRQRGECINEQEKRKKCIVVYIDLP